MADEVESTVPLTVCTEMCPVKCTMQQKMASVLPATGTSALAEPHRAVKRPRAPRKSVTESMDSAAEQLWSAKTRNFLEFDSIAPTNGLPLGGVGVAAGSKGDAAFY